MADHTPLPHHQNIRRDWLEHLHRQGRSQHTLGAYARGLDHFLRWYSLVYPGDFDPAQVMPRDVRDWKAHQQTVEQAAPATVNQRLVALARFFKWCARQGVVQENPAEEVPSIRLGQRQPKALEKTAWRALLRQARGNLRDYAMLELLLGTGLRVSELLALQVGDVVIGERSGKVIVRRGKHGGYREVPLTLDVRKALEAYLEEHPDNENPQAALWLGAKGPLTHRSAVLRLLEKYSLRAELEGVTPHVLRHTFATRYLEANPDDLRGLAKLLGHANLNTVMVYTEPALEDLAARMEKVETGL